MSSNAIGAIVSILSLIAFVISAICTISAILEIDDIYFLSNYRTTILGNKVRRTKQEKIKEFFWPFLYTIILNNYLKAHNVNIIGRILVIIIVAIFASPITILFFIIWLITLGAVRLFKLLFIKEKKEEIEEINYKVRGKNLKETESSISNDIIDAEYIERN